jgi:regulator of protease activity HflC (stomatin/prohibitin superfamily)
MSMQAQAERERQARVILGDSERQVAEKFEEAARTYQHNPVALHLRAMNMLYEGLKVKDNTVMVLVPASVLDTMSFGATTGLTALAKTVDAERKKGSKVPEQEGDTI